MDKNSAFEFVRRRCGYRFPRLGRAGLDFAFKFAPKHVRTELLPGVFATLDLRDEVQRATYWQGERFESPTLQVLNQWVKEGATTFFDIGSNYGFFSLALLARHPNLRVHAFEPNPDTCAHAIQIKAENHLDRLTLWNLGLSDRCAKLELHRGVSDSGHSTFGDHPDLRRSKSDLVELMDFESWHRSAGIDLPNSGGWVAKIDVEGFEAKVLRGMHPALERRSFRGVVVEINDFTLRFCHSEPQEIYLLMQAAGYKSLLQHAGGGEQTFRGNELFVPV
jgi:FkbM family methyltransferase